MKDVRYAFRTLRRSPWYSAMVVCVLGVSMGLATVVFAVVSLWSVRLIQSQLYHVRAFDPARWSAVVVAVVLVSAIGTLIPSRRAARVIPFTR